MRLKLSAKSRVSSRYCCWSSPTGTCVVLHYFRLSSLPSDLDLTHLYASMSAACRTGYVKSPAFNKESSTSDSSFEFLETANRVCESYTCLVMVEVKAVYAKAKYLPRRHPLQLSDRR